MCVCMCVLFQKTNAAEQRERIIIFHAEKREERKWEKERELACTRDGKDECTRCSSIIVDFIELFRIFRQTKGLVKFVRANRV